MERLEAQENPSKIDQGDIVAIMSGKGGVGKTTVAINLGSAIAEQGFETALIDFDLNASNLALELGFLASDTSVQQLITSDLGKDILQASTSLHENLRVLPGSIERSEVERPGSGVLRDISDKFSGLKILDTAPGAGKTQREIVHECDKIIVVMTPFESSFVDGMKIVRMAESVDTEILGVIVNKKGLSDREFNREELEESIDQNILGTVRFSDKVNGMRDRGEPLVKSHPSSGISYDFKKIASELTGAKVEKPSLKSKIKTKLGL